MGLLTFSINVTLDGCVDHQEGIADDETHAFFTRLMDEGGAMLWGRVTYEMMESYWPAVARGDEEAPSAIRTMREWAVIFTDECPSRPRMRARRAPPETSIDEGGPPGSVDIRVQRLVELGCVMCHNKNVTCRGRRAHGKRVENRQHP
jgi:hypothetical protein